VESLVTIASGLAWDPQIRGILAVAVGVVVLCGSAYLLLATNLGSRLGLLVAFAGIFGWMVILSFYWWLDPPQIGPIGTPPTWEVVEIHVTGSDEPPVQREAQFLPQPGSRVTPEQIVDQTPELAGLVQADDELSDIAGVDRDAVPAELFGGWNVTPSAKAGEAQAAADEALVSQGLFDDTTYFTHTSTFQQGGKVPVDVACDPDSAWLLVNACRAWHRVSEPFKTHPTNYSVVEVRPLIPQEAQPGQPPPRPVVDESQPAIWVIMERQLGTTRVLPFTYFIISLAGFVIFVLLLHYRDKTLKNNLEEAANAPVEA